MRRRTIVALDLWLTSAARSRPDHLAVSAPDGDATYADLESAALEAARRLTALGVRPGDRVATTLGPSLAFCQLAHGAWRAGAALVPLNTRLPQAEQERQAHTAHADVTITEPIWNGFEADPGPPPDADEVAAVLFTSGTSGEPKAVELTFANLDASAAASSAALGTEPDDHWLCVLPLFHVAGLAILVRAARAAATLELREQPDDLTRATLLSLVPTQLRRLLDGPGFDAPRLRALLLGGGAVPPDLLEEARSFGIPARCTYGMTETASQVVVTDPWEAAGRPLPPAEIEIADDGEILISGPMVAAAALGDDGWLHTGDVGRFDRAGRLEVDGRLKELIITGGENVAPVAVEAVLLAHPGIADAGVAGAPDREWGEVVTAFLVEREPVADYDLEAFCRERLAGYQVPKRFIRVDSLPRTPGGKLLRRELPGGGWAPSMTDDATAVVRRWFAALPEKWSRGPTAGRLAATVDRLAPLAHPEFEFVGLAGTRAMGAPEVGPGLRRAAAWYEDLLEVFTEYEEKVVRYDAAPGDQVVVLAQITARSVGGGVPIETTGAGVYLVEEDLVRRIELFEDPGEAYAAAGIPDPDGR